MPARSRGIWSSCRFAAAGRAPSPGRAPETRCPGPARPCRAWLSVRGAETKRGGGGGSGSGRGGPVAPPAGGGGGGGGRGGRLRGGHAGPAGGRGLGRRPGAARPLFSRVPPLPRPVPLRQLPPSGRAGLRRTHRRGAGRVRPRPAHLLPAHLRRGQRSFLVQRAASRALIFAIIASKALSRSIPCELARQTTTNRISASSMAREPVGSSCFLVFSPKRWLISRASSPTSSVSRARLVSGEK